MQPQPANGLARRQPQLTAAQRRLFALHPFLAELEPAERQRVLWCSPVVDARPGRVLLDIGEPCVGLLLLAVGTVRVVVPGPDGDDARPARLVERVRPGEVCATAAGCLLTDAPSPARFLASRQLTGILLPAGWFASLLTTSSTFRAAVFESLGSAVVLRTRP